MEGKFSTGTRVSIAWAMLTANSLGSKFEKSTLEGHVKVGQKDCGEHCYLQADMDSSRSRPHPDLNLQ